MDVDIGHLAFCTPQPDTRLRCNVRLRDGRSRQELAAGISRSASAHAQLSFVLCTEPASRRTIGINPIEFAFQLLTPQGIFGGRLGEFALQLLGSLRVFGGDLGQFPLQLLGTEYLVADSVSSRLSCSNADAFLE